MQDIRLGIGESVVLLVQFDPAYRDDHHIRVVDEALRISYREHPHVDEVNLRGEVYFPNLQFEKSEVMPPKVSSTEVMLLSLKVYSHFHRTL